MFFVLAKGTNEYEGATEFVLVVFYHACIASDNQSLQLDTTATCIAQKLTPTVLYVAQSLLQKFLSSNIIDTIYQTQPYFWCELT